MNRIDPGVMWGHNVAVRQWNVIVGSEFSVKLFRICYNMKNIGANWAFFKQFMTGTSLIMLTLHLYWYLCLQPFENI